MTGLHFPAEIAPIWHFSALNLRFLKNLSLISPVRKSAVPQRKEKV